MIFKADWEKTHTRINLSEELILKMLGTYYTGDNDIKSVSIIPGGCANINVFVQLNVADTPVILRVYLRDKESVYREQKISSLLHDNKHDRTIPIAIYSNETDTKNTKLPVVISV